MREIEIKGQAPNFSRTAPGAAPAALSQREKIALYSIVYGLAPAFALEIGSYHGGSAFIISGALDDIAARPGKLLCIESMPERLKGDVLARTGHNSKFLPGFFPKDVPKEFAGRDTKALFEFCFYDALHDFEGVEAHLAALPTWLRPGAFVLIHDGYNVATARGIRSSVDHIGYVDCGMITRCRNDQESGGEFWGGMYLLRWPGTLDCNS